METSLAQTKCSLGGWMNLTTHVKIFVEILRISCWNNFDKNEEVKLNVSKPGKNLYV